MTSYDHSLEEDTDAIIQISIEDESNGPFADYQLPAPPNSGGFFPEHPTPAASETNPSLPLHIQIGPFLDVFNGVPPGLDSLPSSSPHSSSPHSSSPHTGDFPYELSASMGNLGLSAGGWGGSSPVGVPDAGHPGLFQLPNFASSVPSSAHSEQSFTLGGHHRSPSSPNTSFLNVDTQWRGRPRSRSESYAPYSLAQRSRSPSASSYTSELSDRSSINSEASSYDSIDPQLLGRPSDGFSSGYSSYSTESSGSHTYSHGQAESSQPRNSQVASEKTRRASEKRRRKDARFYCSVPGCGGSFTARHNLLNHENAHNGVRNYACNSCGHTFITSAVLKRHTKTCKGKN